MARDKKPASKIDRLLDELMEDGVDADDLFGEDGLLKRMKKRMAERILETELTDRLGYEKHAPTAGTAATAATARPPRRSRTRRAISRATSKTSTG